MISIKLNNNKLKGIKLSGTKLFIINEPINNKRFTILFHNQIKLIYLIKKH